MMNLATPILKSIPALDIPDLPVESGMVKLPPYITVGGIRYVLRLPISFGAYITNGSEVIIPTKLVTELDIKYEIDEKTKEKEILVIPESNDSEAFEELNKYPGSEEVDTSKFYVIKDALEDFAKLSEKILGKKISYELSGNDRYEEIIDRVWGCLKSDVFKGHIPVSAYIVALASAAKDEKTLERIGKFFETFKEFKFYPQTYGESSIFETNVLRLYLRALMIVMGEEFPYDSLDGGVQEKLIGYMSKGNITLVINTGSSSKEYSSNDELREIVKLFDVIVTEEGFVELKALSDITFEKLIVSYHDGMVLEITEEAQIKLGDKLPIIAKVVEGVNVISPNLLDTSTVFTALVETNLKPEVKKIGEFRRGDDSRPIYLEMFMPMDYRGIGKLLSPIPARIGLDLTSADVNKKVIETNAIEAKEDLLSLLEAKPSYRRTRKILDVTSKLTNKNVISLSNIDSMFSPTRRRYIENYIKANEFLLAPVGYNLSAQLLTHLKLSGLPAHGRTQQVLGRHREVNSILFNAVNRTSLRYDDSNIIEKLSESIVYYLARRELRAIASKELEKEEISKLVHTESGITINYELSLDSGYFIWNLPSKSIIERSRGGLVIIEDVEGVTVIPVVLDITDTYTPRPTVGLEYIDSMYNVLYGLVNSMGIDDITILPSIILSGKLVENNSRFSAEFAKTADEGFVYYLLTSSEDRELVETEPYVHQNGVMLYTERGWIQAIGNKFIEKCRCKHE